MFSFERITNPQAPKDFVNYSLPSYPKRVTLRPNTFVAYWVVMYANTPVPTTATVDPVSIFYNALNAVTPATSKLAAYSGAMDCGTQITSFWLACKQDENPVLESPLFVFPWQTPTISLTLVWPTFLPTATTFPTVQTPKQPFLCFPSIRSRSFLLMPVKRD